MATILTRILRAVRREPGSPLNVLWWPSGHPCDAVLLATGHAFWDFEGDKPPDLAFDLVLSQSSDARFDRARSIAGPWNLPHVTVQHESPNPGWGQGARSGMDLRRGHIHLFATPALAAAWGPPGRLLPGDAAGWDAVLREADLIGDTGPIFAAGSP